jgi:hypothetical protein
MEMVSASVNSRAETLVGSGEAGRPLETAISGIAWPAILGGAFAAAALALILLALGSGFGLASVSPWPNSGASATAFTIMAAIWLIIVQWVSAALGGYLTGRLRTKWVGVHTHEVFFRDTANGFLAWAVAAVIGAAVLASAAASLVGGGNHVSGTSGSLAAAGASQGASAADPSAYYVDMLFRSNHPATNAANPEIRAEATRIFVIGVKKDYIPADKAYLTQLVAAGAGLSQSDAEKRVDEVTATAKADADAARKAAAYFSIFTALSMLIGAFIAAVAAALGGQHRDEPWRADIGRVEYR